MTAHALAGIRVIELGHALAGPLAATFLADFGADVVKVERVDGGDAMRAMGPKHNGTGVWWSVTGRNKRSICIDYKRPQGRDVLLELIAEADVLVENFRPGALERSGLGWDDLSPRFTGLIMLRISGFGQTGPYSSRRGFGKIAEAFSGATFLTGEKDRPPLHPGFSLGDATAGLMGAFGVVMALHERAFSRRGQLVDLALYEPLFRMIEWQLPLYGLLDRVAVRNGPRFPFDGDFVTDICATADGHSLVVSAATTESLERLRSFVRAEGTADGPSDAEVIDGLRRWVAAHPRDEALARLHSEGLIVHAVFSAADLMDDPHVAARENIAWVDDADGAEVPMPSALPRLSRTPGSVRSSAPGLGEHTREVLAELGYAGARCDELIASGVVRATSPGPRPPRAASPSA
jgi:crotonobetainyl-CoA:carnitine CoA-transferase CaiB-like acyl-CoA transferase